MTKLDLETLVLEKGAHDPGEGMCVMEAVAFVAGEEWSDHPKCASPVVAAFLRSWNDSLPDDERQELRQFIPRLVGSAAAPEVEARRSWMAVDWLLRTYTPAWLRPAGLALHADALASSPEMVDVDTARAVRPTLDAAWAAAWATAGHAAGDAARAATRDAAGHAAGHAAGAATGHAAGAAAGHAARDALAPTVSELQASARDLVDRMLDVERQEVEG